MSLTGTALLAIWNDIDPNAEFEYNRWHNREHVPERVATHGFLQGRRYVAYGAAHHRYFTLYEMASPSVLSGADYIARLNAPSEWTQRMMPSFLNFVRGGCSILASHSTGIAGVAATIRFAGLEFQPSEAGAFVERVLSCELLTGAHLGLIDVEGTTVVTREREFRSKTTDDLFGGVLVLESDTPDSLLSALSAVRPVIEQGLSGAQDLAVPKVYNLALCLQG